MDSETSISDEAVERVTAAVKKTAGAATGNEELHHEGELHNKKAQAQRRARKQDARAAVTQEVAQAREEEREAATRRAELIAQKRAEREIAEIDHEGRAADQAVQDLADRGEAATQTDRRRKKEAAERARSAAQGDKAASDRQAAHLRQKAHRESGDGGLVPRAVSFGLEVARLPLTVVEKVTGKQDSDWGPAIGFRAIESSVLQVAGSLLRNKDLAQAGRSEELAAHELAEAQQLQEQARETQRRSEGRAKQQSQNADEQAAAKQPRLDRQEEQARSNVAATTEARKAAAVKKARKASEGIGKRHRTDALAAASDQTRATATRKRAVRQAENVVELDEKIEQSKQSRKSS
jgi:uncharacterized protein YjbJ (UPF0337 family)